MENNITQHIEALIFAAPQPIIFTEIHAAISESLETEIGEDEVHASIEAIRAKLLAPEHAFELTEMAGGYQLLTKGDFHHTLAIHLKQTTRKRLSQTAMETLAILAYKQPISKPEMEEIRGVSCDYAIQKLLEKELVAIVGRAETPGKPLLYGTTDKFMDYLGINSMEELPKPKDFKEVENTIGEVESSLDELMARKASPNRQVVEGEDADNELAAEQDLESDIDLAEGEMEETQGNANEETPAEKTETPIDLLEDEEKGLEITPEEKLSEEISEEKDAAADSSEEEASE